MMGRENSNMVRLFRNVFSFCCMVVILGWGTVAFSSEGGQAREVLTLQQLIDKALTNNPQIMETQADIGIAESDLKQASWAFYPQLEVIGITGVVPDAERPYVMVNPRTNRGEIITPIETDEIDGFGPFGRLGFTMTQPIYTFGKISNRKEAAEHGVKVAQSRLVQKKGDIILQTKALYYALILAKQGLEEAKETDTFFDDANERIKRLIAIESPNADESDLYKLEAYRAKLEKFKARAKAGYEITYMALKTLIGYPPERDFDLSVRDLPSEIKELSDIETYIQKAKEQRPEFTQLEEGLQAKKLLVDAAKSDLYPSFFALFTGSFAGAPGRDDVKDPYLKDDFNHTRAGAVAGLKWNFDFGIGKAKIARAHAEYVKLKYTKDFALRSIPLQVAKYYKKVWESSKAFEAYKKASKASRKWIVVAFANFDMGVGSAKEIFDAIEKHGENRGDYLLSLYEYNLALAKLEHAVGDYR